MQNNNRHIEYYMKLDDIVILFATFGQIKASSWLTNHVQNTRLLNVLYRCMTTVRSCAPSVSFRGIKVPSAGKFLYPTTKNSEVKSEPLHAFN